MSEITTKTDIKVIRAAHKAIKALDTVAIYNRTQEDNVSYSKARGQLFDILINNGYSIQLNNYRLIKIK